MKKILLQTLISVLLFSQLHAQNRDSFYSIQTHFGQIYRADIDSSQIVRMLDLVKNAGITAIRDEVYWSLIEKEPAVFQFPELFDFYISEAVKRNLDVLLILDYNNPLYAPSSNSGVSTDSNRSAFAKYCRNVAERYFPLGVKNYEIWNEPNIPIFWSPVPNAEDYYKLLEAAYPALKSVSNEICVVGCATSPAEGEPAPFIPGITFIQKVFAFGGGSYLDGVSFHQYHVDLPPEDYLETEIARLQAIVGKEFPIWLTETGYPTNSGWPNISPDKQAHYIPRLYLLGKSIPQLKRISYYDLKDDGADPGNPEHHFGILNYDLLPKPAYFSLKAAANLVGAKPLIKQLADSGSFIFEFSRGDSAVISCWRKSGEKFRDIEVTNDKLAVLNRDGNVQYFSVISGDTLNIRINENITYILSLPELPKIQQFSFSIPKIILFPDQIFTPEILSSDTGGIPVHISRELISWKYSGNSGSLAANGDFISALPDSGLLIGEFSGFRDSINVAVVKPGNFQLDDFQFTNGWQKKLANLDSTVCSFTINDSISSTGSSSGKIFYRFTFNSQIPRQDYQFNLENFLPIPGKSDSLLLDLYGDGNLLLIGYQFQDVEGNIFSKKLYNFPIDWKDEWRTISFAFSSLRGNIQYPIFVIKIVFYLAVSPMNNGEIYSGNIYLDNLRSSLKQDTKVLDSEEICGANLPDLEIFPNPINSEARIRFFVPVDGKISIDLYNILGQKVLTVLHKDKISGAHSIVANFSAIPSGLYFLKYQWKNSSIVKKILFMK